MFGQLFTTRGLPEYHDGMLLLKMRPVMAAQPSLLTASVLTESVAGSVGLSAMSVLERAGLVRRVVPLTAPLSVELPLPAGAAMAGLAASLSRTTSKSPAAVGACVVELEHDKDVPDLHAALANDPGVEFVSRVPIRYLVAARGARRPPSTPRATIAATPPAADAMWNLRKINWADARALPGFREATTIRVAVLDTGIDASHPDLKARVKGYVHAYPDVPTPSGPEDIVGHGTHVSGTIAALINNEVGINGICEAQLYAWKIFSDQPHCFSLATGFQYYVDPVMYRRALADCLDAGVDVINLSIGGPGKPDPQEQQLFDALLARGTTIVAAMGNERQAGSPISYPAAIPGVIAVGATTIDDSVTNFSNRGDHIALSAPGKAIWSTLPTYPGQFGFEATLGPNGRPVEGKPIRRETDYDAWNGTSMASPHVAAGAALVLAKYGALPPAQVREYLTTTADKVPAMSGAAFDSDYGSGRLNLLALLR